MSRIISGGSAGIEDDDRLAAVGAADRLDRPSRGLGELVDVGARAGTGAT